MLGDIHSEANEPQDLGAGCSTVKVHSYLKVPSHWYFSKIQLAIFKKERKKASSIFLEESEGIGVLRNVICNHFPDP